MIITCKTEEIDGDVVHIIENDMAHELVFYHGGGVHKGAYWGVKSGGTGTIKVVDPNTYVPMQNDKALIIYGEDW